MTTGLPRRLVLWAGAALACAALLAAAGYLLAARALRAQVLETLGPAAQVDAVLLRLGHVVIEGLKVPAPAGWPAPVALSARRVVLVPELRTLLSDRPRIARIELEDAYLSVLRTGDGRLRVLPGVLDAAPAPGGRAGGVAPGVGAGGVAPAPGTGAARSPASPASGRPPVTGQPPAATPADGPATTGAPSPGRPLWIGRIELRGGALDYFDGSVARTPHRIRIDGLDATLADLALPSLAGRSTLRLSGTVRAAPGRPAARDGRLAVDGWIAVAARDAKIVASLRNVDLVALQPYLIRSADTGVRDGTLDLDLDASVAAARLSAPGSMTLSGLELAPGGSFAGLPREAVLALLKDRQGRIRVDFVLQGRLDDPRFSISEDLAVRAAASIAASLGISLEGLVRGVGGAGRKGADAAVDVIRGLLGR
jgi:hypothetical protein